MAVPDPIVNVGACMMSQPQLVSKIHLHYASLRHNFGLVLYEDQLWGYQIPDHDTCMAYDIGHLYQRGCAKYVALPRETLR